MSSKPEENPSETHQDQLSARSVLAAGIAHDLNNLFMSLVLDLEYLLNKTHPGQPVGPAQMDALAQSLESVKKAAQLSSELQKANQAPTGEPFLFSHASFFKEAAKRIQKTLPENIRLHYSASPDHSAASKPKKIPAQDMLNLLAGVFAQMALSMPQGGQITFSVSPEKDAFPDQNGPLMEIQADAAGKEEPEKFFDDLLSGLTNYAIQRQINIQGRFPHIALSLKADS